MINTATTQSLSCTTIAPKLSALLDEPCQIVGHFLKKPLQEMPVLDYQRASPALFTKTLGEDTQPDLSQFFAEHPADTFLVRAVGESMMNCIRHHDLLVADRTLTPEFGNIVIVTIDGKLMVKYLKKSHDSILLMAANPKYEAIALCSQHDICIWGVVSHRINYYAYR